MEDKVDLYKKKIIKIGKILSGFGITVLLFVGLYIGAFMVSQNQDSSLGGIIIGFIGGYCLYYLGSRIKELDKYMEIYSIIILSISSGALIYLIIYQHDSLRLAVAAFYGGILLFRFKFILASILIIKIPLLLLILLYLSIRLLSFINKPCIKKWLDNDDSNS